MKDKYLEKAGSQLGDCFFAYKRYYVLRAFGYASQFGDCFVAYERQSILRAFA